MSFNSEVFDPPIPTYTALSKNTVPVNLKGVKECILTASLHPRNLDIGTKTVWVCPRVLIEQDDAELLEEGKNATFINYGNVMIDQIHKSPDGTVTSVDGTSNLDNKGCKETLQITWLADSPSAPLLELQCIYFNYTVSHLLDKDGAYIRHETKWEVSMVGESALGAVRAGDVVQLQRRGFFRADVAPAPPSPHTATATPLVFYHMPDGPTKQTPS